MVLKKRRNWSVKEQANFFIRLGYLLQKGYTLAAAIEFIMLYQSKAKQEDIEVILVKLKQGVPFNRIFQQFGFSSDGLSYLFFAEKHGDLATGLLNAGALLEKKQLYKEKLGKVMRYPLFLILFVIVISVIMKDILLPQFMSLYESVNLPRSQLFEMLVIVQSTMPFFGYFLLFIIVSLTLYYLFSFRKKTPIDQQSILCKIPIIRFITRKYNTYFFAYHLGNLLASGVAINESLSIFEKQTHLLFFRDEANRIRRDLIEGEQLESILKDTAYYDDELATVIIHGQANGIVADELLDYSSLLLEQLEHNFKLWLQLLQPIVIILVGLFVVLLYLAVMLPVYGLMQTM